MKKGKFIVFEGIDGSGKTTLCKLTCELLNKKGTKCIFTYEPSDSEYGRMLRDSFTSQKRLPLEEELRLFMLDRNDHVNKVIMPNLMAGIHVICDRYYFSTMAYQGARGGDIRKIREDNEKNFPKPDLVFLLDITPEIAIKRITYKRGDKLNNFEDLNYLKKVYAIFSQITEPPPIIKLNAQETIENLLDKVLKNIEEVIKNGLNISRFN